MWIGDIIESNFVHEIVLQSIAVHTTYVNLHLHDNSFAELIKCSESTTCLYNSELSVDTADISL